MKRSSAVAVLMTVTALAGCSAAGDPEPFQPTDVVKIDEGAVDGAGWTLVTFHNADGETCLELRDAGMRENPDLSGGCGPWNDDPTGGRYMDGKGPGRSEFAYGLLKAPVATVTATAPGQSAVTVSAKSMPEGSGAAKFFVIAFPDDTGTRRYTAKDDHGAPVELGP
ncbi:hypothetical protein [Actinoplanes regularis]|uniref:hypothetical protein n=1 Tax=Actinoplanes regularis TaxID=52697 RepID=UPI0024A5F402|nr:hypothetical protein [Actinoplanes regularis]GLW29082.1 hypothetical protein Areg01_20220 [Actinoplanes regularis]